MYRPTIAVIEQPQESCEEYHQRRLREAGARRVPFGFSRALEDDPKDEAVDR